MLLRLTHRQFVFTIPKCLRPYFIHNRTLFSDTPSIIKIGIRRSRNSSHLLFELIQDYYNEVSGQDITTGLILSHQTAGDFARIHPHWHGILIEGGFDDVGNFVYLPISSTIQNDVQFL